MIRNDTAVRRLAASVVLQALDDWRKLCHLIERGKVFPNPNGTLRAGPTFARHRNKRGDLVGDNIPTFNFLEIEAFIRDYAELFCDIEPERIMPLLDEQRRSAVARARSRYKGQI